MEALIALASAFSAAGYFVYISRLMKQNSGISPNLVLCLGHLAAAIAIFPFVKTEKLLLLPQGQFLIPLLLTTGLLIVSRQLYYFAYARTDVANITVFSALTPVYALGAGYVLLGEVPAQRELTGLLLICAGVYSIFLKYDAHHSFWSNILKPFSRIATSPAIATAFLSTIPTAIAAVYQKKLLVSLDPFTFSFVLLFLIGIVCLALELATKFPVFVKNIKLLPWHFYFVSMILFAGTHVLFCYVLQEQHTAVSLVLQRCAIVFQIVLAYFFLKEKKDIQKRVLAAGVIMAGFVCIVI